jgi:hypothetical protein
MASLKEYLDNRRKDNADLRNRIETVEAKQAVTEQDVEANAEAIEELAQLITGGDE